MAEAQKSMHIVPFDYETNLFKHKQKQHSASILACCHHKVTKYEMSIDENNRTYLMAIKCITKMHYCLLQLSSRE